MSLRPAAVIPYCEKCGTHFAHKCKHFTLPAPEPRVWEIDKLLD